MDVGWKMVYIAGVIPFNLSGVLSKVLNPLAAKKISVLVTSSYDTDYIFFKKENIQKVHDQLKAAGFQLKGFWI